MSCAVLRTSSGSSTASRLAVSLDDTVVRCHCSYR
jgi:hypothetical protein